MTTELRDPMGLILSAARVDPVQAGGDTVICPPPCETCKGIGRVFSRWLDLGLGDGPEAVTVPCPACHGRPQHTPHDRVDEEATTDERTPRQ